MAILNNEAALHRASDLTKIAMEHGMITSDKEPERTAENVYKFYKTLYENFSGRKVD